MTAIFKKNKSPDNKCAKVFDSGTSEFEVYFIEAVNVVTPRLTVVANLTDIIKYNYCDIPELGRKYFIRDVVSLDAERAEIALAVDVLSSFYDDVVSAQILTNRSSKNVNVFVPDTRLKNSTRGISQIKTFSGGEWLPTVIADTNGIVITTFGGGVLSGD